MKKYSVNELRDMFLDYFKSKEHLVMKSFSLVPHNDNSLLLINSGMAPLKPYFTGQVIPPSKRVATCQKCIRTGDIENVGKTARHGTFFEMLGNFSFGDYFKKEAIHWTWEFLTQVVGLEADRLYPSIYTDDDEAFEIWNKDIGIAAERIFRFGKEDNFWEHGSGPCGPCSEVYYDRGEKYGCHKPTCTVGCDCDRYMEVWNNVFTQFDNDGHGNYTELDQKNIDTGMGLERLAVVVQDVESIFEVDTLTNLLDAIATKAGVKYKEDEKKDVSLRVIADHIRSCTFMISDGILPKNEGRGYVLRRLLRRAARHGRLLGIKETFLASIAEVVIEDNKGGYPELFEKRGMILKVLTQEEEKFHKTIEQGLAKLSELERDMTEKNIKVLSGEDVFKLYDTYGFPLELTKEILDEKGYDIDEDGFNKAMTHQRETARKARKVSNYMGADSTVYEKIDPVLTTTFSGYDKLVDSGNIIAICSDEDVVEAVSEGEEATIVTDNTCFYATMGGQLGDIGLIRCEHGEFEVHETIKLVGEKVGHTGRVTRGMFATGEKVELLVDKENRNSTCKNHSSTHLLHKALKDVLGEHVEQSGSFVSGDRLRFDFTHFAPMTREEIRKVQDLVNEKIREHLDVCTAVMALDEAKKSGAVALFGEKYHNDVRVVSMGDFSKELCGGTHVKNTGDIGTFKIVSEAGIAAGVRRIEALTDVALTHFYEDMEEKLESIARELKTTTDDVEHKIKNMLEQMKLLKSENDKLKSSLAKQAASSGDESIVEVKGIKLLCSHMTGVSANELRNLGDSLKAKVEDGVVALFSDNDGKVDLIVMAGQKAIDAGAHAGNIVKQIASHIGGSGGGRPNMAQAGGKDASGISTAINSAKDVLESMLK